MPASIRFAPTTPFLKTLRARADAQLAENGVPRHGGQRILLKSAAILSVLVLSYVALVFWADAAWQVVLFGVLLSQSIAMVGFNIMHDGGHRAFSSQGWLNRLVVTTLDLIGGSHVLWMVKHGHYHHSFPNIDELDDDIETNGLLRLHPDQPWRPIHRYQVLYAPLLYSLLAMHWTLSDFPAFFRGKIGNRPARKPTFASSLVFLGFKAHFFWWTIVLPLLMHPWWLVLGVYLFVFLTVGFTISLVFQLAHISEKTELPAGLANGAVLTDDWAAHQLRTTVDFAPRSWLVGAYMGGLNHQVIHHLLPRYSHVRYRTLQPIVAQTAAEFGLEYRAYPTVWAAVVGHARALYRLGRPALSV